jgi:hypothetical protein
MFHWYGDYYLVGSSSLNLSISLFSIQLKGLYWLGKNMLALPKQME